MPSTGPWRTPRCGRDGATALEGVELAESLEGRLLRFTLPGPRELVIVLRRTPRGTHCALAEYGVTDKSASGRWPRLLERLTRFLR